eukprot:m51a1_g2703 putative tetratricopeptide repeat (843) ;mRNA; r:807055-809826
MDALQANQKAALLFDEGRHSDAIKVLTRAISSNPGAAAIPQLLLNRAACYSRLELFNHCVKDCDTVIARDGNCQAAYLVKGRALSKQGKHQAAVDTWRAGAGIAGDFETRHELRQLASAAEPTTTAPGDCDAAVDEVAAKGLVQHGVGDAELDKMIAIGYLLVNTGQFDKAIEHFSAMLARNDRLVAAYLGRGTAHALRDFGRAIAIDQKCADAWLRRGQARAAVGGCDDDALVDLDRAVAIGGSTLSEALQQRGQLHMRRKDYRCALADYKAAVEQGQGTALLWNHVGLAATGLGDLEDGIAAFARATVLDPSFKDPWSNMAQAWRELGVLDKSLALYDKALQVDPKRSAVNHLRGNALFGAGRHAEAVTWFDQASKIDPRNTEHVFMRAVCRHGLGQLVAAASDYALVVSMKPDHTAWYMRECALLLRSRLSVPLRSFDYDGEVDPYFKEAWCKHHHPATLVRYRPQPEPSPKDGLPLDPSDVQPAPSSPELEALLKMADHLGSLMQYDSQGFMPNKRQQRSAGLAMIQAAQWLRNELGWMGRGLDQNGQKRTQRGWRDLFTALVRWRQIAEPNDPVWWVDRLSPEQFAEGYGSHTPMFTGQTKVVRYNSQWRRAFAVMRSLAPLPPTEGGLGVPEHVAESSKEPLDLYQYFQRDFFVETPCKSTRPGGPSKPLEGTRLTVQAVQQGVEFSIRTPCTPPRWAQYDAELKAVWSELCDRACAGDCEGASALAMRAVFYWYNFMPLSRGTAAVGFAFIQAVHLAVGVALEAPLPRGMQPDWEAILCPDPQGFSVALEAWLGAAKAGGMERTGGKDPLEGLPDLDATIRTVSDAIVALNTKLP